MIPERLLTTDPTPVPYDGAAAVVAALDTEASPFDAAVVAALRTDRIAWAFAAGYRTALARLVPSIPLKSLVTFAVTESGGNGPRAIEARLAGDRLRGRKSFATFGDQAAELVVVGALEGSAERNAVGPTRPTLRALRVPRDRPGVAIAATHAAPFVPEILHAEILFDAQITPADLLPGDGWTDFVKPFRTLEDLHVQGAVLGHVLGVGRRHRWPEGALEELLASIVTLRAIAELPPSAPATHVTLAGALARIESLLAELDRHWVTADPDVARRWRRDRPLSTVAARARSARRDAAWRALAETRP